MNKKWLGQFNGPLCTISFSLNFRTIMYVMAPAMIILFLVMENAKVQTFICATQETNVTGTVDNTYK